MRTLLEAAARGGALGAVAALFGSVAFEQESEERHKLMYALVAYKLVTALLLFDKHENG